jgi:hypothetical protein
MKNNNKTKKRLIRNRKRSILWGGEFSNNSAPFEEMIMQKLPEQISPSEARFEKKKKNG